MANDAPEIQAAIDAAAGRGPLRFPATPGAYYRISSQLVLRSNSHLIIEAGATIKLATNVNANMLAIPYNASEPTHNILIELYGTLDGNRDNNPTVGWGVVVLGSGIVGQTNTCRDIYVRGNRQGVIQNVRNGGINITCCTNGEVSGITVRDCGNSTGFGGNDNNGEVYSYNVGFSDCTVSGINDLGLVLYGGVRKGFIRNCEVYECVAGGISLFSDYAQTLECEDCEIVGCVARDNPGFGISVVSNLETSLSRNTLVRGNRVFGNVGPGIVLGLADGVLVENNFVHDNVWADNRSFSRLNMTGDIMVGRQSTKVSIIGNLILNPQVGCPDGTGYGIALDQPDHCAIIGNRIEDAQTTKSMMAALGGNWGATGSSSGNSYGPRINTVGNFPADLSLYQVGSVQGVNYDTVTGYVSGLTFQDAINGNTNFPPKGLTVGVNYNGSNETNFIVGADNSAGGFDFLKAKWVPVRVTGGTNTGGAISMTTDVPHGVAVGDLFGLSAVIGVGADIISVNGRHVATAGTTGTMLNCTISAVLGVTSITSGNVNHGYIDGGVIDTASGVNGSLLANDGFGNTRLGGALTHGAMQTAALVNAGTVTVNANTSFVMVTNTTSIASASVVLPAFPASAYAAGAELEINFQNPVGALTVSAAAGASVAGAPTTVTTARSSVQFINTGTVWTRRIPM
jgi:hypothetical protein